MVLVVIPDVVSKYVEGTIVGEGLRVCSAIDSLFPNVVLSKEVTGSGVEACTTTNHQNSANDDYCRGMHSLVAHIMPSRKYSRG